MDYELLDTGAGRRLERFGEYVLDRPDPEVLWNKTLPESDWQKSHAVFNKNWIVKKQIPDKWTLEHNGIKFLCKLTPFKHTGVFPEQAWEWDFIYDRIKLEKRETKVLNLFAYTGVASLFAAMGGAKVTHVDASKPAITWANENRSINNPNLPIRWIVDDALIFAERAAKRGERYDAIIMDPPVYGHGPTGKPWDFSKNLPELLKVCQKIISDTPIFFFVNAYAVSSSPITLANTLQSYLSEFGGKVDYGELTLKEKSAGRFLSTGIWARWTT